VTDFAMRVIEGARRHGPLCLGIDPHPERIPALFGGDTPAGAAAWGMALVDLAKDRVCAVKPQVGLFERFGPDGMRALQTVAARAADAGLLVLMDAKRGDIGTTAEGYARAYLSPTAPFACDALTVNPYMGLDTLEPFVRMAEAHGKGVIVLARTSNPGAADFQTRDMQGHPLFMRVVDALAPMIARLRSPCGWSSLMLVTGATGPAEALAIRMAAPDALFLVPGYGAQGASARDAMAGFVRGEGGLVNASRAVTFPASANTAATRDAWAGAVSAAIDTAKADLASAVRA
jgi:orotidine-5'-phosphate decarboxylase